METGVLFKELKLRDLIYQVSDPKVASLLDGKAIAYAGFDPSGPSLGVGNLMILVMLLRLLRANNKVILLVGGATGLVGDPGGKEKERDLLSSEIVQQNCQKIADQLNKFFTQNGYKITIENNANWLSKLSLIEFLREVGKKVTVNQMLVKESVKRRVDQADEGISYAEFSYMLLQAYDFLYLYDHYGCNLQIGASEQWGNISQGIELIRRSRTKEVYGLTTPLLLKADGSKFGKSEKGNIWLDPTMTSPYEFYQFFYNLVDEQAISCLRFFSLRPVSELDEIISKFKSDPKSRLVQKELAYEMTQLVHGERQAFKAKHASELMFSKNLTSLSAKEFEELTLDSKRAELSYNLLENQPYLTEIAKTIGLTSSLSEARRLIAQGGLYLNNLRVDEIEKRISTADLLHDKWLVLRSGKSNQILVVFNK